MSEKDLDRLYDILDKLKNNDEKASLRKAIFILENLGIERNQSEE